MLAVAYQASAFVARPRAVGQDVDLDITRSERHAAKSPARLARSVVTASGDPPPPASPVELLDLARLLARQAIDDHSIDLPE